MRINIFANSMVEPGMSGGNRIFIELCQRWQKKGVKIRVFTSDVGVGICRKNGLEADFIMWRVPVKKQKFNNLELTGLYFLGLFRGLINLKKANLKKREIVYSSSDYWPDLIPAAMVKLFKQNFWLAGFFLLAPKPWQKDSPYRKKHYLLGWLYWLTQLPAYRLVKSRADLVLVTSRPDQPCFITKTRPKDKVIVVQGGVDMKQYRQFKSPAKAKYQAVFIGRLHPQKGVLELVDIWRMVVNKIPRARLAVIGDGPEKKNLESRIKNLDLSKNINCFGFLDGKEKTKIIKQAKIVVHPAIYDSGGMAAMEAMACGLPGVSFDLPALKSYYPQGMIKVKCFDKKLFAGAVMKLLNDQKLYNKVSQSGLKLAQEWDWDKRAKQVWEEIGL